MVTSAPLWLLPMTVSISKSQNTKNRCPVLGRRLMIYENDYMVFTYFSFQFTYASSFLHTGILALGYLLNCEAEVNHAVTFGVVVVVAGSFLEEEGYIAILLQAHGAV